MALYYNDNIENVNINPNMVNGIPQYQDMNIFAELIAVRKERSVLIVGKGQKNDERVEVNFIGNNQNQNNPNYLKFTSNYYDGSTNYNEIQYESFGISNIKIEVNSSYVPQVSIQFVDIRGLSFFNQEKSPYRILFDFPPPIFTLKIKGFYGRALEYDLHLIKYTSEFKADNGNFVIDAQFIAVTFAPLTDVLLRYVINFPLIDRKDVLSYNSDKSKFPINTYDLILKLRNLYDEIRKNLKNTSDNILYEQSINRLNSINNILDSLNNYMDGLGNSEGTAYLFTMEEFNNYINPTPPVSSFDVDYSVLNNNENERIIKVLSDLHGYDDIIKSSNPKINPDNIKTRLYIGYTNDSNNKINLLVDYAKRLISLKNDAGLISIVKDTDIKGTNVNDVIRFTDNYDVSLEKYINNNLYYSCIDITNYYVNLYHGFKNVSDTKNTTSNNISKSINNAFQEKLGMLPTIYNVFSVILNDVDLFFNILRNKSMEAEEHHNLPDIKKIIINNGLKDNSEASTTGKIYAFPLIVDAVKNKRISPVDIDNLLPKKMPEIVLVNDFINTFKLQQTELKNIIAKELTDENGVFLWIPISGIDSKLGNSSSSPYINVNYLDIDGPNKFYKIILERFYALSQGSIPSNFYGTNKSFIDLFSESEALNLALYLENDANSLRLMKNESVKYSNKGYIFLNNYVRTQNQLADLYNFQTTPENNKKEFVGLYIDKTDDNFVGIKILDDNEIVGSPTDTLDENKPLGKFATQSKPTWKNIFKLFTKENDVFSTGLVKYTNQNLICITDNINNNSNTRYLISSDEIYVNKKIVYDINTINTLVNEGNSYIKNIYSSYISSSTTFKSSNNIVDVWSTELGNNDTNIYKSIIDYEGGAFNEQISSIILLSSFGYALGGFNQFGKDLSYQIFQNSSVVEIPNFLIYYMGSLVDIYDTSTFDNLKNYFIYGEGKYLSSLGAYIFADIHDVNKYLSSNDKNILKERYRKNFMGYGLNQSNTDNGNFYKLIKSLYTVYHLVQNDVIKTTTSKKVLYQKYFDTNSQYFKQIFGDLLIKKNLIVYSEIVFKNVTNEDKVYRPISELLITSKKDKTVEYFDKFFYYLNDKINTKEKETIDKEKENDKFINDLDIITQTYYSLKNINDKWLVNPNRTFGNQDGYPYNVSGKKLIDSFIFVDRAMNPIGDTIINPEILTQLYNDTDISIFSVLSQLLSANNFLFFPMQNFMTYADGSWADMFKIDSAGIIQNKPAFVCMYAGGFSKYPTTSDGRTYSNDGIENIKDNIEFNNSTIENTDDKQYVNNPDYPWGQVRAFNVNFGQQNQSMFSDIKIDSTEYTETNESLQILARFADNESTTAQPKGQNLYNMFENRAYGATVMGFGNATIQPTQYFQLNNVPIFNGAYLITSVTHEINANMMKTNFTGTKILQYPIPRVTSPATIIGFDGSFSDSNITGFLSDNTSVAYNADSVNESAKLYNELYTLKIK